MSEASGLYEIVVAVVGTAKVAVHAETEAEALATAEACVTPMQVHEWHYFAEEVEIYPAMQQDPA